MRATFEELPSAKRRRLMLSAVVQPLALCVGTVAVYYAVPLDSDVGVVTAAQLGLGLVVVAGLVTWQTRSILRADYPRVRAVQALAATFPLFVVLFASAYFVTSQAEPSSFNEGLSRTDSLYFTMTVLSTVGFGDIVPLTVNARVMTMTQMLGDLLLIGVAARVLLGAVRAGVGRRRVEHETPEQPKS